MRPRVYSFDASRKVLRDPTFWATFSYSLILAAATIVVGVFLVVPTAYWVRLKLPQARPFVEFVTLLPLVIPAIVLVFGYIRLYNTSSVLPLTGSAIGTDFLLTMGYTTLALPTVPQASIPDCHHRRRHPDRGGAVAGRGWITILAGSSADVMVAVLSGPS